MVYDLPDSEINLPMLLGAAAVDVVVFVDCRLEAEDVEMRDGC